MREFQEIHFDMKNFVFEKGFMHSRIVIKVNGLLGLGYFSKLWSFIIEFVKIRYF